MRIFKRILIKEDDFKIVPKAEFPALVAQEAYNLEHEYVLNKIWDEFTHGHSHTTGYARSALIDLDREMKAFAKKIKDEARAE